MAWFVNLIIKKTTKWVKLILNLLQIGFVEPAAAETKTLQVLLYLTLLRKNHKKVKLLQLVLNKRQSVTLKVGDDVLYGKYSGTELQHEGGDDDNERKRYISKNLIGKNFKNGKK